MISDIFNDITYHCQQRPFVMKNLVTKNKRRAKILCTCLYFNPRIKINYVIYLRLLSKQENIYSMVKIGSLILLEILHGTNIVIQIFFF